MKIIVDLRGFKSVNRKLATDNGETTDFLKGLTDATEKPA